MSGELLLLVEDNEKNMKLVRDLLQVKGYATLETETAEEGIQMAREKKPDLILMDIQLPGISGIEALSHLRDDPGTHDIPVVAVTASAMSQDREKIMAAGFDGYQRKPLEMKEFLAVVGEMLGRKPKGGG